MFATIPFSFTVALIIALVAALVFKYQRTRDTGFIWLGVAVVVWPIISGLLQNGSNILMNRVARGESTGLYPFSLVQHGQMTVGNLFTLIALLLRLIQIGLLLAAVFYLRRTNGASDPPTLA